MQRNAFDIFSIEELYNITDLDIDDVDADFSLKEESGDYLNRKNNRNRDNTYQGDYNCGGFALNTFNWYKPYEGSFEWREQLLTDWSGEYYDMHGHLVDDPQNVAAELENRLLVRDVLYMLRQFKGKLRRVSGREDLWEGERLIAYRVGLQYGFNEVDETFEDFDIDFHFRFFDEATNCWVEKLGGGSVRSCFAEEASEGDELPWVENYWSYTSDIIYLALQL